MTESYISSLKKIGKLWKKKRYIISDSSSLDYRKKNIYNVMAIMKYEMDIDMRTSRYYHQLILSSFWDTVIIVPFKISKFLY